jgi:hypothetical protein
MPYLAIPFLLGNTALLQGYIHITYNYGVMTIVDKA